MQIAPVLHRAAEMGTYGRYRVIFAFGGQQQQSRPAAKSENLRTVRFQISHLGGHNFVLTEIGYNWRHQIFQHRV